MSLPATRFALSHVGASGGQRSHPPACADPQIHCLLWGRQLAHREVRPSDVQGLQRRDFPTFSRAAAGLSNAPTPHDRSARQCSLSSRGAPGSVPAPACSTPATAVSAAVQSPARSDRARLEADPAPCNSQSLLPHARRTARSRQCLLQSLAAGESGSAQTMLHYLDTALFKTLCLDSPVGSPRCPDQRFQSFARRLQAGSLFNEACVNRRKA